MESHLAARAVDVNKGDAFAVACITQCPGWTARELDAHFAPGQDRPIGKRIASLIRRGVVIVGASRACRVTGHRARTYWVAKELMKGAGYVG